jgi:hypothetical protein
MAIQENKTELEAPWVKPGFWEEPYQPKTPRWEGDGVQTSEVEVQTEKVTTRQSVKKFRLPGEKANEGYFV